MRYHITDDGYERIATIDIETTHYKPTLGETVSIGIGFHHRGTPGSDATYEIFHRKVNDPVDESELIERAIGTLGGYDADTLVSYKGRTFDLQFLSHRYNRMTKSQGVERTFPTLRFETDGTHVDLFELRKARCDETGERWPSLEACLHSYHIEPSVTTWQGSELTNKRFGEELGPAYLSALDVGDESVERLKEVIEFYLLTDLEANIALFYADIGEIFEPAYLGGDRSFSG